MPLGVSSGCLRLPTVHKRFILGISAICYFAMLSGEGFKVLGSCREFYW